MQDAYRPIVFQRNSRPLRAVMIDNQPWFVAADFARLIGVHCAIPFLQRMEPHQMRSVVLACGNGRHELVEMISDAAAYQALGCLGLPNDRDLSRWLSEVLVPTLHDYHRNPDASPQRDFMTLADQRISVVKWQGETWIACKDLLQFTAALDL